MSCQQFQKKKHLNKHKKYSNNKKIKVLLHMQVHRNPKKNENEIEIEKNVTTK